MMDPKLISQLRELTGAGIMDCRKALEETDNNFDNAVELLRKRGQKVAANKQARATAEGLVHAYVHASGKSGAMVEVLCETDFVARTENFQGLLHDLALHITAMNPLYIKAEDVPEEVIAKEKEIYKEQLAAEQKSPEMLEKIAEGKIQKFYQDVCLMKQSFIKDDSMTIEDLVNDMIAKTGENIQVKRFARFAI